MPPHRPKTAQFIPVDLPEVCAPREQLMSVYKKACVKRCVYVSAPAGSGKTVSTLLWLKKSNHTPVWISLDHFDNSPTAFYRVFLTALFSVATQEEGLAESLTSPAFSASPVEFTLEALARIGMQDGPHALVFDDFHLITNEEVLKSFYYVMKRLPLSFTVIILSRGELPEAFFPYQKNEQIALVQSGDLAFNSEELLRHFASFGHVLTAKEAQAACSSTEGWALAVGALAINGSVSPDEMSAQNPLQRYFGVQVWNRLDQSLQRFMMHTAIVDKFNEELCLCVTEHPESRAILSSLLNENLFLSCQEGEFRYHHLFLLFLREQLAKDTTIDHKALHQKAAMYYYGVKDYKNALFHYIQGNCPQGVADALSSFLVLNAESGSDMQSIAYINKLPQKALEQNPCLYVGCAWYAFFFGKAAELFHHLDRMYARIGEIIGMNRAFLEPALLHYVNDPRYSISEQFTKLRCALASFNIDAANIPRMLLKRLPHFLRTYRDFSHYAGNTDENFSEFRAVFLPLFGEHYAVLEAGMRSWLLYNQNRIREALSLVTNDVVPGSPELTFLSKLHVAACLYAAGKEDDAARLRSELALLLKTEGLLHLLPVYTASETKFRLLDGDRAAAKAWFECCFVESTPKFYKLFMHATTVRAYIVLGEHEKAKALCNKLRELCAGYRRVLDVAEADMLLSIILWLSGSKREALELFERTLLDMQPYGYVRIFAEEGKAILPLLKSIIKNSDEVAAPDTATRAFLKEVYLAAYEQAKRHRGIASAAQKPVRLSKQQKHVLTLLARGYRNSEIVVTTGLSINTIRYHTKIAYQKLEVTNAMDAVLRARELELLE